VLTGPFSPLFGPFFRAKRAGPARLGPLRAGLGQKLKPAGSAGPARFWPGFTGPGRAGPARLAISNFGDSGGDDEHERAENVTRSWHYGVHMSSKAMTMGQG
jgi:hypothetical protein